MTDTAFPRMLDPSRHAATTPTQRTPPEGRHPDLDLHEIARQRAQALRREALDEAASALIALLRRTLRAVWARVSLRAGASRAPYRATTPAQAAAASTPLPTGTCACPR